MFNRNTLIVLLVAVAAALGLHLGGKLLDAPRDGNVAGIHSITFYPQPRTLQDFNLAQPDGTRLIPGELQGHWTLVFLGFTTCPDICPTTLTEMAKAQNQWQNISDSLRPRLLFVSVDPERDSPTRLGDYVHAFHRDTLAATADIPSLERFTTSLGLVFQKIPGEHFADNPNDYSMGHSAAIAVLDPQARLAGVITPPLDPQAIAADLIKLTQETTP